MINIKKPNILIEIDRISSVNIKNMGSEEKIIFNASAVLIFHNKK